MPSPFPGMDPYLENPALWRDVHHAIISDIQAQLTQNLRPNYTVRVEERCYVVEETDEELRYIIPDLKLAGEGGPSYSISAPESESDVAVAEPLYMVTLLDDEVHEARLVIRDRSGQQVVAVIEVLSPTNKIPGTAGHGNYIAKRRETLQSTAHLVEIDLLRGYGRIPRGLRLPPCEYLVHVSRRGGRPGGTLWPIRLTQRMPVIDIPLKEEEATTLNLQSVIEHIYDRAGYDLSIDYTRDLEPPLSKELAVWVDALLRDKGLRRQRPS